ncbi:hypothetical protein BU14_0446s0006 [Porphyra umbilicalis]|uniref:Peptidase S59 domain-containing protein n=1 Tax=Porphyra umbilicalis TaxID=2786 RepID=A0A1X6NUM8_PORUM|nr:hypothetical protein BU14_0446s0006 [Porphyra umbilicalis]|eukprot:OSX72311.1 hypothetical protein BU14_0446s0006 [Porphyra umbilicalis]
MCASDLAALPSFVAGVEGAGEVTWDGPLDLTGVDVWAALSFGPDPGEVAVDAEAGGALAAGPATVVLEGVVGGKGVERALRRYVERVGGGWGGYEAEGGVWTFRVPHF